MAQYLDTRRRVMSLLKEGELGAAKKMIREEIKATKYLKQQLRSDYSYDSRKRCRPLDDGAKLSLDFYSREQKFYQDLLRKLMHFQREVLTKKNKKNGG